MRTISVLGRAFVIWIWTPVIHHLSFHSCAPSFFTVTNNWPPFPWPYSCWYLVKIIALSIDQLVLNSTPMPFLIEPCLVWITMAPLFARDPYNAVALGPFSTVMPAISSGLISLIPSCLCKPPFSLVGVPQAKFWMGTPSTMYRGWLFPAMDLFPPQDYPGGGSNTSAGFYNIHTGYFTL